MEEEIEIKIVGADAVPPPRYSGRWAVLLRKHAPNLKPGQYLRVVVPKGKKASGICGVWTRICTNELHKKAHTQQQKQKGGSTLVWLSFEEVK